MNCPRILFTFALVLGVVTGRSLAREVSPREDEEPQAKGFAVYVANCSRSLELHAEYADQSEALLAATGLRGEDGYLHVAIVTGNPDSGLVWSLLFARSSENVEDCSVFVRGQRCGNWFELEADEHKSVEEAEALASKHRERQPTEIIFHFKSES